MNFTPKHSKLFRKSSFLIFQSLRHKMTTPPPSRAFERSFLMPRVYSFGHINLEEILSFSHVSEIKQMSMLFVVTSEHNAAAVSSLANDLAFIITHFGTTLAEGGPACKIFTDIKLRTFLFCLFCVWWYLRLGDILIGIFFRLFKRRIGKGECNEI